MLDYYESQDRTEIIHVRASKNLKEMISELRQVELKGKYYNSRPFGSDADIIQKAVTILYYQFKKPDKMDEVMQYFGINNLADKIKEV